MSHSLPLWRDLTTTGGVWVRLILVPTRGPSHVRPDPDLNDPLPGNVSPVKHQSKLGEGSQRSQMVVVLAFFIE